MMPPQQYTWVLIPRTRGPIRLKNGAIGLCRWDIRTLGWEGHPGLRAPSALTSVLRDRGGGRPAHTLGRGGGQAEGAGEAGLEMQVTRPQARECRQPLAAKETGRGLPQHLRRRPRPAETWRQPSDLFLHGLESNPGSYLQTEEEAGLP